VVALRRGAALRLAILGAAACSSPEARRERDGGPGGDPGNKVLVEHRQPEPRAADTTLWPGRAPAPVERFARGEAEPATFPAAAPAPVPAQPFQRTFDRDSSVDPLRPSDSAPQ
jgi:hypothetical protein